MSSHFRQLFLLGVVPLVQAYTVFETTCSVPSPHSEFMFVSSPNTRGTLDILWSSFFTIIACTWTLQHPNLPENCSYFERGLLDGFKRMGRDFDRNSVLLMIITVLVPEYTLGRAFAEQVCARQIQRKMQHYADKDHVSWSLTHSYYAYMGGFAIRNKALGEVNTQVFHLPPSQIYKLRRSGLIKPLPDIDVEEMKDKCKSDAFAKTIAICQILWTMVQIIARTVQRLPVSPLEIAVVALQSAP